MAEISKITLPNGDTYDIKDAAARENADHGNARIFSADCSTAAATQRKDVTIAECTELIAGDVFVITFTNYQNYNGAPTIQINSLGAKNIRRITGTNAGRYEWASGETIIFVWNGTYFLILNGGFATTTVYGRTKLYTGAGSSSTALALTPASLYNMANRSICPYYSTSETYAVGDKVRYGDYIYECITAITTAEAWTEAHWEIALTLQEQITALDGNVAAVQNGLAIIANGNTHASVAKGQFVYVRNHSTLADGLYKASSAINTNTALSTSNLTADGSGGLNDLQSQVTSLTSNFNTQLSGARLKSCTNKKGITITYSSSDIYGGILAIHNGLISSIILSGNSVSEIYSSGAPVANKTMNGATLTLTMNSVWTHWLFIFYGDNANKIVSISEVS